MSAASDYLENKLLDHVLKNTAYTQPSNLYVGLFTASTGLESNSPTSEVSGNAYARKTVAFDAAASGTTQNTSNITFDTATGTWGTITHIAVMDASSGGNVLFWGAVATSKLIESGDTFQISADNLVIALS